MKNKDSFFEHSVYLRIVWGAEAWGNGCGNRNKVRLRKEETWKI